jgi:hypothetical protein
VDASTSTAVLFIFAFNLRMQEETFGLTMIYNVDSGGGFPFDSAETMQVFIK